MKKISVLLLMVISLVCFSGNVHAQGPKAKKIAVYVEGNVSKQTRSVITSAAMARLSGSKDYKTFERNETFLRALIKEHDYELSGNVPQSEIRKVGNRLGVDYVMVLDVNIIGCDTFYMRGSIIDIQTGQIYKSADETRKVEDNDDNVVLISLTKSVVFRLIDNESR